MAEIKRYDEGARRRYYDMFVNQHTMSMSVFCRRYDINKSTFKNWVSKYQKLEKEHNDQSSPNTNKLPNEAIMPVSKTEYSELQKIKFKYLTICSIMNLE